MTVSGKTLREPSRKAAGRRLLATLTMVLVFLLAACAAPPTGPAASAAADAIPERSEAAPQPIAAAPVASAPAAGAAPPAAGLPPRSKPAPPMSDPLPAQRLPDATPAPARLDVSCRTSADCAVKDVGNCCGYYPRCVNVNAAVDPKGVQAQCARSGMASVCGFKSVEGCECVQGECRDTPMPLEDR